MNTINLNKERIKTREHLEINVFWIFSHWPLIDSINNDESWPVDILSKLDRDYSYREDRIRVYKELLANQILKSEVYLPLTKALEFMGCKITLDDHYGDPIYMKRERLTKKEDLITWKAYSPEQVKKVLYPNLNGPIHFNMSCNSSKK